MKTFKGLNIGEARSKTIFWQRNDPGWFQNL